MIPASVPVSVNNSPAGNAPAVTATLYGGTPPDAFSVPLYGTPTIAVLGTPDASTVNGSAGFDTTISMSTATLPIIMISVFCAGCTPSAASKSLTLNFTC